MIICERDERRTRSVIALCPPMVIGYGWSWTEKVIGWLPRWTANVISSEVNRRDDVIEWCVHPTKGERWMRSSSEVNTSGVHQQTACGVSLPNDHETGNRMISLTFMTVHRSLLTHPSAKIALCTGVCTSGQKPGSRVVGFHCGWYFDHRDDTAREPEEGGMRYEYKEHQSWTSLQRNFP